MKKIICLFQIFYLLYCGCTQNPFSNATIIQGSRTINGTLILSDLNTPNNVFVWLKNCDTYTFTDNNGNFTLELPAPAHQPNGPLNGIHSIYFYLVNYLLDSVRVGFINGIAQYETLDLNQNGQVKTIKILEKIINVQTSLIPQVVHFSDKDTIQVEIALKLLKGDYGNCIAYVIESNNRITSLLKPIDANNTETTILTPVFGESSGYLLESDNLNSSLDFTLVWPPEQDIWMDITSGPIITTGTYEYIPYIHFRPEYMAPSFYYELINKITSLSSPYLLNSIKREGGDFQVTD